jgi:zinc/manganese transport system substrate-binding protein
MEKSSLQGINFKRAGYILLPLFTIAFISVMSSCKRTDINDRPSIVVTYSILGSIVQELVGDKADVVVSIPNGLDPHEWEPSAKSIEALHRAALVVRNGLGLEEGMERVLKAAEKGGCKIFTASDHITVRRVGPGEGIPSTDPHQTTGASDPHLWTDPVTMEAVVEALVPVLKKELDIDVTGRAIALEARLEGLDQQIRDAVSIIAPEDRKLVTGHESMGYFARRYNFKLIGVIVPGLSSQASVSAADLSDLKKAILADHVSTIFTEQGTSPAVARVIGDETGVKVVELDTHVLPADGSYFTLVKDMADTIINALK